MGVVSKLSPHGVDFVESMARKLGYKSATQAEEFLGPKAFNALIEKEAVRGPAEGVLPSMPPRQRTPFQSPPEEAGTGFTMVPSKSQSAYEKYLEEQARKEAAKSEFRRALPPREPEVNPRTPRGSETSEELESVVATTEGLPNVPGSLGKKMLAGTGLAAGGAAVASRRGDQAPPTVAGKEGEETSDTLEQKIRAGLHAGGVIPDTGKPADPATADQDKSVAESETLDQQRDRLMRETQSLIDKGYTPTRTSTKTMLTNLENTVKGLDKVDQEKYNTRLRELEDTYKEYSKRSEWAEVAEMIGQSLVSMAASISAAKAGVHVDPRSYLRPTDWEARRTRRLTEMESAATRIERERAAEEREVDRLGRQKVGLAEQNLRLAEKQDEAATQASRDKFKAQIDSNLDKIKLIEGLQERLRREAAAAAEKGAEVDKSLRASQISNIRDEISKREKQLEAVTEASLLLQAQKDLGRKEADKLVRANASTMSRAGVTPELLARIDQESTKKGLIWDSIDQDKKKQLIQQYVVQPKVQELDMLRGQLSGILGGEEATPAARTPPAAAGTVRVRHIGTGETRELTREQAARLPAAEFEIVQ